jgi:hypothetical protein
MSAPSFQHLRSLIARHHRLLLEELEDRVTPVAGAREQYMLELVNRMRQNPAAELPLIVNANDPSVNNALAFFHVDRNLLATQWASLSPAPPLAWNDFLGSTALAHSQAMLTANLQAHQLPGEQDPFTRMTNAGYNWNYAAENIYAYAAAVFDAEAGFAIDWGYGPGGMQNPAGHRKNLMDSNLREVGIGLVDAPPGSPMGPLLVTQDFGNRFNFGNPWLLGSVFDDTNHDGFYSQGEGLGGVTVTIAGSSGTLQTTTAAAGGYQLQVPAGTYQVTAVGVTRTVTVGSVNVEAEFIRPQVASPTLNGPPASGKSTTPTFSWTAVPNATRYALWVNNVSRGQSQVIYLQNLTGSNYTPATPLPAGSYQAWVMAFTAVGSSPWSAGYSFTIMPPTVPTLTAPAGTSGNTTPTFTWTASTDAARYDLWVDNVTTGQSQVIRQQTLTTNTFTALTALPTGTYTAWVEALNNTGDGAGWSAGLSFTISAPAAPTLTGPAAVISSTTPTFTWNASAGAASYELWADNRSTGQSQVVHQTVTTTSFTAATAIPRGNYVCWVRAANGAGAFGSWSAGYHFLIDTTAPAVPTVTGPAAGSNLTPTVAWSDSAAARYDMWVDNLTTGQSAVIRQQNLVANSYTPLTALSVGTYRVWVEAFDNANLTRGWSNSFDFTIAAPDAPTLLGPLGATTNPTPTFSWAAVANAVRYDLWVDSVTTNTSQVIRRQNVTTTSFTSTALALGSYRFWVRAFNANGDGGSWSGAFDFTIG